MTRFFKYYLIYSVMTTTLLAGVFIMVNSFLDDLIATTLVLAGTLVGMLYGSAVMHFDGYKKGL